MTWLLRTLAFFVLCFFVLPLLRVEDPFRSISLRFFSQSAQAKLYEHRCDPDRTYLFSYELDGEAYLQRYDGYVEPLDDLIPEPLRCTGTLQAPVPMAIRFVPFFRYWSEPEKAIRPSLALFFLLNAVKLGSVLLIVFTFVRRRS
ncbi:MAG: hypothetical protein KBF37_07590 [Saprospiraceae bacterium]|nr:hypothetical protein [Saprospiraceae bacterium]MBP9210166.1 hypothetical protein [Saprospiraceae bacterium]